MDGSVSEGFGWMNGWMDERIDEWIDICVGSSEGALAVKKCMDIG